MRLDYGFFCHAAELVEPSHFSVLRGGITHIPSSRLPVKWPLLTVVLRLSPSRKKELPAQQLNVRWIKPGEKRATDSGFDVEFSQTDTSHGAVCAIRLGGVTFDSFGTWNLEVSVAGKAIGKVPIEIVEHDSSH